MNEMFAVNKPQTNRIYSTGQGLYSQGLTLTINSITRTIDGRTDGDESQLVPWNNTGNNYVEYAGLTPNGSGEITGTFYGTGLGSYGAFNGFQIVGSFDTVVPEPGTVALLGMGGLVLWWRRRFRQQSA